MWSDWLVMPLRFGVGGGVQRTEGEGGDSAHAGWGSREIVGGMV